MYYFSILYSFPPFIFQGGQCEDRNNEHCSSLSPGRSPVRTRKETLQVRNSPPTHQIRDAMAAAGSPTHSMQVMLWKHAAPRCPSTQPAAGAKSPCGRLLASERMLDDRVGAGRAGVVAQASCQRCVSHSSCSRPFVGCHRMRTCVHCKTPSHVFASCFPKP